MKTYDKTHKLAKAIVTFAVIALIITSKYAVFPFSLGLDVAAVLIWFWGINPVAYMIEKVKKQQHKHTII